jgi:hypothetical protein
VPPSQPLTDRGRHRRSPPRGGAVEEIVDIIRDHGPGGTESEDGILLELV